MWPIYTWNFSALEKNKVVIRQKKKKDSNGDDHIKQIIPILER